MSENEGQTQCGIASDECPHLLWPVPFWKRACNLLAWVEKHKGMFAAGIVGACFAECLSFVFAASWYTNEVFTTRFTGLSQNPFQVGDVPIPYSEHRLRLLGPVIAWAVGLRGIGGTLIPVLANIPMLGLIYIFIRQRTSVQMGLISVMLLATTHLTMTSRTLLGYHDSLVYICCLGALLVVKKPVLQGLFLFLAMYGDMRAILICPFILIWPEEKNALPMYGEMAKRTVVCISTAILWAVSAKLLLHLFQYDQMTTSRLAKYIGGGYLDAIHPKYLHLSAFMTFKAGWLFLFIAIWRFWLKSRILGAYVLVALFLIVVPAILVHDVSRALGFCFPLIILGLVELWRVDREICLVTAGVCLAINLLTPFYHGFTFDLWEMSYPLPLEIVRQYLG